MAAAISPAASSGPSLARMEPTVSAIMGRSSRSKASASGRASSSSGSGGMSGAYSGSGSGTYSGSGSGEGFGLKPVIFGCGAGRSTSGWGLYTVLTGMGVEPASRRARASAGGVYSRKWSTYSSSSGSSSMGTSMETFFRRRGSARSGTLPAFGAFAAFRGRSGSGSGSYSARLRPRQRSRSIAGVMRPMPIMSAQSTTSSTGIAPKTLNILTRDMDMSPASRPPLASRAPDT